MSAGHTSERRRHYRIKARKVTGHLRAGEDTDLGLPIENISSGGLLMGVARPLAIGTRVELELTRAGGRGAIRVQGRVVSARPVPSLDAGVTAAVGVRFEEVSEQARERLDELLRQLSALGAEQVPHPAQLDPDTLGSRAAFDFGFRSLSDESRPPEAPRNQGPTLQVPEDAKLKVQVTGLMMELGESQSLLVEKDKLIASLRAEVEDLRAELERRSRWIDELEAMVRDLQRN